MCFHCLKVNESVTLLCDYELAGAELYSVKWSHDDQGFYRFFPRLQEPRQVFASSVVTVDLAQSDHSQVRLSSVSLLSSGVMRCEVTTEGPMFLTVAEDSLLTVMEPPSLTLLQTEDSLEVDCHPGQSGSPTYLPPNTTFYLNGSPLRSEKAGRSLQYSLDLTDQQSHLVNISCSQDWDNYHLHSQQKTVRLEGQLSSSHRPNIASLVFFCLFISLEVSK